MYIVDYESTDPALKAESDEVMNIEKKIEALMINFDSPETPESDEVVEKSAAFIIGFEVMNESEIIAINLINRFFSHRFGLHPQPETYTSEWCGLGWVLGLKIQSTKNVN